MNLWGVASENAGSCCASRRFVSRAPLALPQWYRSHTCQEPSQATSFDSLRDGGSKTGSRNSEGLETTGFRALEKGLEKKGARSGSGAHKLPGTVYANAAGARGVARSRRGARATARCTLACTR